MKIKRTKAFRKVMAILLAIAIVFGMSGTFATAAETPIVYIDATRKILYITSTGWYFEGDAEKAFVGNYFLYGTNVRSIVINSGDHNIISHNLSFNVPDWYSAFSISKDSTVNLTVIGVNEYIAYNHPGITGEGTVNLTVAENSSIYLDRRHDSVSGDYSVAEKVTFNLLSGTAEGVDMTTNAWKKDPITITNGTSAEHAVDIIGNADGHYLECNVCNIYLGNIADHINNYTETENGHTAKCIFCGFESGEELSHNFGLMGEEYGHRNACVDCGYYESDSALEAHTATYTYNSSTHSAKCTVCNYDIAVDQSHDWECSQKTDGTDIDEYHNAKCTVCGYETSLYHDIHAEECENGHSYVCYYCKYTDGVVYPHEDTYYDWYDEEYCAKYCYDCGAIMSNLMPHDMSRYVPYDETYCIVICDICGYGDSYTTLVEHDFTGSYEAVDSEGCAKTCKNCGEIDSANIEQHVESQAVEVEPNGNEPGYTATYCKHCNTIMSKTFSPETLVVTVSDEEYKGWGNSGLILYIDGVPTELIRYMGIDGTYSEAYGYKYDANKSYVFKHINGTNASYNQATVSLINADATEQELFSTTSMTDYYMLETILEINTADYSAVDDAIAEAPASFEEYTSESVEAFVKAIKEVKRMLPATKQESVDKMATAVKNAVKGLELNPNGEKVAHGVINSTYYSVSIYNDDRNKGYYMYDIDGESTHYDYSGDYVVFDAAYKEGEYEIYSDSFFEVVSGKVNVDIVNYYIVSEYTSPICLWEKSDVTLNLYGANASASTGIFAGIKVAKGAHLTIEDKGGNLIAIGGSDCAGIGSEEYVNAGSVTINSGTIFALSRSDGAGIGGGYEGNFETITINDGKIWAECLMDDGPGIGVGEDGNGGDIIINGGDITALAIYDDGAGIGGADKGSVDSITINGGKIVAGSDDAAAIGSGQDSDSSIGKITINGGEISASQWHDSTENLIGKGNSNSQNENESNFVHINGGIINTEGTSGINPKPRKKTDVQVSSLHNGNEVIIELSNGEKVTAVPENGIVTLYLHEGVTVSEIIDNAISFKVGGNFTSFGGETETVIQLIAEGEETAAYEFKAVGTKSGLKYTGVWSFDEVEAGTYTVKVTKDNHITRTYTITVADTPVVQDVQVHRLGDISGDGRITTVDIVRLNSHLRKSELLTGYELECADVTGEGKIATVDLVRLNAHVRNSSSIW